MGRKTGGVVERGKKGENGRETYVRSHGEQWDLTLEISMLKFGRSVVGTRRLSTKTRENSNKEPMNLMKSRNEAHEPGERSLAARERRSDDSVGPEAGATGRSRAVTRVDVGNGRRVAGKWTGFSHIEPAFSRLFPH